MQRQTIDEALWTLQPASFLPHGHAGSPDEAIEPILISGTLDPSPPNRASLLALADGEWRDEALGFERIFLLFDNSRLVGRAHSELQSLMRISYAVFCLKKKKYMTGKKKKRSKSD